nr:MAG: hypothetical protein [Microvirus sp.]
MAYRRRTRRAGSSRRRYTGRRIRRIRAGRGGWRM